MKNTDWAARRIADLPPYVFDRINRDKEAARAAGRDIIDLGMGNPDLPTPPHIVERLVQAVADPATHRYSASRGVPALREAVCGWYRSRHGVTLDPDREVTAVIGSKEGLCHFALAAFDEGDAILTPDPTYPAHVFPFRMIGVETIPTPLLPGNGYRPDLARAKESLRPGTRALLISYPHNPTTGTADREFFAEAVSFCRREGLFLVHDLAYGELVFGPEQAPSVLEVPGAGELAIEFFSLSKTYSMAGWRVGFAVGNERLVGALAKLKSYYDYGIFRAIQEAAIAALTGPQACVNRYREEYRARGELLVRGLGEAGWEIAPPPATMYLWAPLPPAWRERGSLAFSAWLMDRAGVAVAPGIAFGRHGEGFVRIAMVETRERLERAVDNIGRALGGRA